MASSATVYWCLCIVVMVLGHTTGAGVNDDEDHDEIDPQEGSVPDCLSDASDIDQIRARLRGDASLSVPTILETPINEFNNGQLLLSLAFQPVNTI
jgi:hypothetical protein